MQIELWGKLGQSAGSKVELWCMRGVEGKKMLRDAGFTKELRYRRQPGSTVCRAVASKALSSEPTLQG